MKKQLLLLSTVFLCHLVFAVSGPAYNWAGSIGGIGNDFVKAVKTDAAGNVYVTGNYVGTDVDFDFGSDTTTLSSLGSLDIFLAKYSSSGQLIWVKSIGGADAEEANDLAIDQAGNVWITGYFQGTADFNPSANANNLNAAGGNDIFLAKYDNAGNYLWAGAMSGTGDEFASAIAVSPLTGNICIAGRFDGSVDFNPANGINQETAAGAHDIFFAVFSTAGVLQGEKKMGSTGEDYGIDLAIDNAGNIFLTGRYAGTVDFNPVSAATNSTSNGNGDGFLAKYNSSFVLQWTVSIGGANAVDFGLGVAADGLGNAYVCGYANGTIDFDPSVGTATVTTPNNVNVVGYVAKYSSSGVYQWANAYWGSSGNATAFAIALDANAHVYVTGYAQTQFDADPSASTVNVPVLGHDPYLLRYSTSGSLDWGSALQSGSICLGNAVHLDASNNIYVAGYFNNNIEMDITQISRQLISPSATQDGFLVKYSNCDFPAEPVVTTDSVCIGNSVTLTATGTGTISWYSNSTGNDYLGSGNLNIGALQNQLTVWAQDSTCGPGIRINKTVYMKPMPTVTVSSGGTAICLGQEIGFTATGADIYLWNTLATTADILETPTTVGNSTYTVIGTNLYGCVDTASINLTVNTVPAPNITASATTICKGDSVLLDDLNFTGDDYIWSTGEIEHNIKVAPNQTTDYFLSVVNSFSCFAYDTVSIVVNQVDVGVIQNANVLTSAEVGGTYQWINCATGNLISNATAATYTATANGDYAVVVTGVNGCIDTSACQTVNSVGIEDVFANSIQVSPNPFTDKISIDFAVLGLGTDAVMEIYNAVGGLVKRERISSTKHVFELTECSSGFYLLRVISNGQSFEKKLIKE